MHQQQEYKISGVSVLFPCKPYPSQFSMMDKIIKGIERRQHCLIESPTGSGKSLALLCSTLAWQTAEKVKQDLADAEEAEKGVCTCAHIKDSVSSPTVTTISAEAVGDKQCVDDHTSKTCAAEQPNFGSPLRDGDDDFKSVSTSFKRFSKDHKKHITIAYESDQEMTTTPQISSDAAPSLTKKADQDKFVPPTCTCDGNRTERRPKTKIPKIYFGTRTHKQVAQIIRELRRTGYHGVRMTVLGSREHTCIHPQVSRVKNKTEACKELLNGHGCQFKDSTLRLSSQNAIKSLGLSTAWDLEDMVNFCKTKRACPYFLSRGLKEDADLIICPYNYLVDPMVRDAMQINLKGHIVILDEAHNIEDSAREAASQSITQDSILKAIKDIESLMEQNINLADHSKLRSMLKNLSTFIDSNKNKLELRDFDRSYTIWTGFNIVAQLETLHLGPKLFPEYKKALATVKADAEQRKEESTKSGRDFAVEMKPSTQTVLEQMFQVLDYLYRFDLKYVDDYRTSLFQSYSYAPATDDGMWLNSKSANGGRMNVQVDTYTLNFWCMNPGVAFSDFSETRSIILTSGTLSPLTSFESELGLEFKIQLEANHVIEDSQVWVGTLGQGPTGSTLQAVFKNLETFAFQDELGNLVLRVCQVVPYGVLCFLPSYKVLDKLWNRWESTGLKRKLEQKKIVIREPRNSDKLNFEDQLNLFYEALKPQPDRVNETDTDGAVFFAVCRGKVSEGLDFADNFARAVITVGVPYPNFKDVQVELKRKYNDQHHQTRGLLPGHEWYEVQAFRALNQALGRCIRHRHDWGALMIVDDRFVKSSYKYCKNLSKWVRNKVQIFQDFGVAMESLSKFTAGQLTLMDKNDSLESPLNNDQDTQIKISNGVTACDVKTPDINYNHVTKTQQAFPIFNMSVPWKTKPVAHNTSSDLKTMSSIELHPHQGSNSPGLSARSFTRGWNTGLVGGRSPSMATQSSRKGQPANQRLQTAVGSGNTTGCSNAGFSIRSPSLATLTPRTKQNLQAAVGSSNDSGCSNAGFSVRSPSLATQTPKTKQNLQATVGSINDSGCSNGRLSWKLSRTTESQCVHIESATDAKLEESILTNSETAMFQPVIKQNSSIVNYQAAQTNKSETSLVTDAKITNTALAVSVTELSQSDWSSSSFHNTIQPSNDGLHSGGSVTQPGSVVLPTAQHPEQVLPIAHHLERSVPTVEHHKRVLPTAAQHPKHVLPTTNHLDLAHQSTAKHDKLVLQTAQPTDPSSMNSTHANIPSSTTQLNIATAIQYGNSTCENDITTNQLASVVTKCISITAITPCRNPHAHPSLLVSDREANIKQLTSSSNILPSSTDISPRRNLNTQPSWLASDKESHIKQLTSSSNILKIDETAVKSNILPSPNDISTHVQTRLTNSSKQIYNNKRFLFKNTPSRDRNTSTLPPTHKPTSPTSQVHQTSPLLFETSSHEIATQNPPVVTDDPNHDDPENEDRLLVRRKIRGTKRKYSSKSVCQEQQDEEQETSFQSKVSKIMLTCSVCGYILMDNIQQTDFQEQRSVPSFLRETDTRYDTGCLFFQANAGSVNIHDTTRSITGTDTKYVEQEDICVQFIHCRQCLQSSTVMARIVGAQVKLAAGSGARFSKGQIWLFLNAVSQRSCDDTSDQSLTTEEL